MSRKRRTHLRGKRGQAFADKIRGIPLERVLCVSLDIHKYFHVVMIHNALGEIVTPTFEIDIFQAKIIAYAQKVLPPDVELIAIRCELLAHDLALLE